MEKDRRQASAFRINQTGYDVRWPVRAAAVTEAAIRLADSAGRILRAWDAETAPVDAASGERVRLLDMGVLPEGVYELTDGHERRRFTVSRRPWQGVTSALVKGLSYQRCGCGLDRSWAGPYAHPACHTAPALDWLDHSVRRDACGGWHDAGDYGRYVGPGAVTVGHLLYAWLLFPQGCSEALGIPETGSGVPDILSECRFELEWILKMQREDGAFWHKLTKARFAPFIAPELDREQEYLMPVSHCATGAACACLALASRVYAACDAAFADRMRAAALRAWDWLEQNPDFVPFVNPEGVQTGEYGDDSDRDERFWAACELLAATGEERFRTAAEALFAQGQCLTAFGWADVGGFGALCCLFAIGEKAGSVLYGGLREAFLRQTEEILALTRVSGYGTALAADAYVWGSILPILSGAMAMILAARLTGREELRDAALLQWHYALGMNAVDTCFVTGFGERTVLHPHHRPSASDGVEAPVPGQISGGPNKVMPWPATVEKVGADTPPAKFWLDETESADTNEIAIYWNSPAVFVGACFSEA